MLTEPSDALQSPDCIQATLNSIATFRGCPLICLIADMDHSTVWTLRKLVSGMENHPKLSVLLESPGGTIEDAYRIILNLRRRAEDIEVLVPFWAKSAATFFCLSASEILMGPDAELGPLDPQILDKSGSQRRTSPLETFKALEQLLNYSGESLNSLVKQLLVQTHMDIPHAIERVQPFFASIVTPLYQQIDPHELGEAGRYLSISEDYAIRVMKRWGYPHLDIRAVRRIVKRLVWYYPTHGYIIDLEEAKEIGLAANMMDESCFALCQEVVNQVDTHIGVGLPESQSDQSFQTNNLDDTKTETDNCE